MSIRGASRDLNSAPPQLRHDAPRNLPTPADLCVGEMPLDALCHRCVRRHRVRYVPARVQYSHLSIISTVGSGRATPQPQRVRIVAVQLIW